MSNSFFKEKFRLRISDFDCHDNLLISTILDLCQDVAGKHADFLNVGYNKMISEDKIWMILRTKFEVIKKVPLYSTVVVKTWPNSPGRVDMDRDYLILSEDEKELYVKVTSKWVVCSYSTRKILRAKEAKFDLDYYLEEKNFNEPFDKIEDFDLLNSKLELTRTTYLDLDHNGHINNVKYGNFIINAIEDLQDKTIKRFQIDCRCTLIQQQKAKISCQRSRYWLLKENPHMGTFP